MTIHTARCQPPPLRGTSFHGKEGEYYSPRIRHFEQKREIFFVRGKTKYVREAASGKRRTPGALEERCFMQTALRRKKEYGKRKRSLGSARDDDTRDRFPHIPFNPSARANLRPFGPHPSVGRREKDASLAPHAEGLRYENTAPPHSSFRAKARNLFRSRSRKYVE